MASYMQMPLLMVDASKVLGSYVGQSEQNLRAVLKIAEAVSPAILFLDEAEKMLPQGTSGDSGVSSRIFGMLLTWMQERPPEKPVLVAMTANDPLKLPVELFNRFDATFFVDLPTPKEREEIWAVQIRKAGRDPKDSTKFDIPVLAARSEGWSGREMEMTVSEALVRAFEAGRELNWNDIADVLKERIPLSVQRREDIEKMRKWGKDFAIPASTVAAVTQMDGRAMELE
jgi:SpoVK/Ycf46/Vps4 family AAA+-type ATPase